MGILNALKSTIRGAAKLPSQIRGAMYQDEDVYADDYASNPGYQIMGPLGGIIDIPESEGPTGTQSKIGTRKSDRPTAFGNVMRSLPRMISAGAAAASAPGRGQGGFAEMLRGMDIGRDRVMQDDALAMNMRRQMENDRLINEERMARIRENDAQAANQRRLANQAPPTPRPVTHSTLESALVAQWEGEQDPVKKEAILKQITTMKGGGDKPDRLMNVGGAIYDPVEKKWMVPPKQAAEEKSPAAFATLKARAQAAGFEEGTAGYKRFMANGGRQERAPKKESAPKPPSAAKQIDSLVEMVLADSASKGGTTIDQAMENVRKFYQTDPRFAGLNRRRVLAKLESLKKTGEENAMMPPRQAPAPAAKPSLKDPLGIR
jgi:hypothetical protein